MKDCTLRLIIVLEHLASNAQRPVSTRELVRLVQQHRLNATERTIQRCIAHLNDGYYWVNDVPGGWQLACKPNRRFIQALRCIVEQQPVKRHAPDIAGNGGTNRCHS